ncbi:N-acetyltransferase [Ascochyta rabiei]|uniref:N-acetyltransferase n=1 Tax=Didymella rabiei TaxID=5454 RepID=A0A163D1A4_DIDRA|nr:N-acetyltransferase [Ascochyta rabiei]
MPLELHPLRPADALSYIRIRALAYYGPTHDVLHKGPISEASIFGVAEDRKRDIGAPNVWHWKIVDTDLPPSKDDPEDNGGRTIAIAVWKMMNADGKDERKKEGGELVEHASIPVEVEVKTDSPLGPRFPSFLPPELRLDALASLFDPLDASRGEIMGTENTFFMLNSFATHPDHQGRGAGSLLLDWGTGKADNEGLVTYLDATQVARPVYEKRGFEVRRAVEWDRTKWGGEGKDVHFCMVRQPKSA